MRATDLCVRFNLIEILLLIIVYYIRKLFMKRERGLCNAFEYYYHLSAYGWAADYLEAGFFSH